MIEKWKTPVWPVTGKKPRTVYVYLPTRKARKKAERFPVLYMFDGHNVFYDEDALLIDDPAHSEEEERFILLGYSFAANLLVVCHCYRQSETTIRIISARKATKNEAGQYYERK